MWPQTVEQSKTKQSQSIKEKLVKFQRTGYDNTKRTSQTIKKRAKKEKKGKTRRKNKTTQNKRQVF